MKMDEMDRKIIEELRQNSRLSMSELGRRVHLSSPSVTERVRQMESFGIIKQYTIDIDHEKLGFRFNASLKQPLKIATILRSEPILKNRENVEFCYRIAGNACYMLKMQFEHFSQAEQFINDISPYATTVTHFIFSQVETR
ncbi:LOW QUALITY PROTEIN: HTH-type transcriptional regulator LrpC [Bacillus sp. JCM 19046]|nr:LOW QUALITY PROTEIN: HTH-type transcriptional regulator LrpC [Bacillus sp. JCM 19045]GAF17117.1 LOW QUALITY PROTEIN: HTH-type transcriptional regulator LrpC [Bacillus sp. JCM 19046]